MAAHVHAQLLNSSKLGESLGVSYHTVRAYFELLEQTFVVRLLHPFESNIKKRLVKSPKLYLRDVGVLHALLGIRDQHELLGHPPYSVSFEGLVVEHALAAARDWRAGFYRTSGGAEIDLVLERSGRRVAIECKAASVPNVTRGFRNALEDLSPHEAYVVAPVDKAYPIRGAEVVPLRELASRLA